MTKSQKSEFMRELLSDMSDNACAELYDSILKGYWMEAGRVLDSETFREISAHFSDNAVREPDQVERNLQDALDRTGT